MSPKSSPGAAPVALFFEKVHHPMRNQKLGKVPSISDPILNIELAALGKHQGEASEAHHIPFAKDSVVFCFRNALLGFFH